MADTAALEGSVMNAGDMWTSVMWFVKRSSLVVQVDRRMLVMVCLIQCCPQVVGKVRRLHEVWSVWRFSLKMSIFLKSTLIVLST